MKRTLLEILSGLAVIVLLASFHHQIAKLKLQDQEVSELRGMVEDAVSQAHTTEAASSKRLQSVVSLENKISHLEAQVSNASLNSRDTHKLQQELEQTRQEAAMFKAQLAQDLNRTQQRVDAYQEEMRAREDSAMADLKRTWTRLDDLAGRVQPNPRTLTQDVLSPAVQLNGDDTVGSGTLIYSAYNEKSKKVESYVITAYHVVRNILSTSPEVKKTGLKITVYDAETKEELLGDMITYNKDIDTALIKLRSDRLFSNVAKVMGKKMVSEVQVWDSIYAVGCPLGNDPIPTQGEISSMRNELNGTNYWMINAPTYFGNSGGGVYLGRTRELAGVFSKIYTHGQGTPVVIPHMGLFTPLPPIYSWLEKEKLDFVLTDSGRQNLGLENLAAPGK